MNVVARCVLALAVVGPIGLTMSDAFARSGGATGGQGGPAGGPGSTGAGAASGGHYGSVGVNGGQTGGGEGGHYGTVGGYGGHGGEPPPSRSGGDPPVFSYSSGFTAFAATSGACGMQLELPDTSWQTDHIAGIEVISQQTQNYLSSCGCDTQACVADALDKYASALEQAVEPAPPPPGLPPLPPHRLPKAVRDLPRIVHEAATRVRAAPTTKAAQKAVQEAIEIVQKTAAKAIPLLLAADPDAQGAVTRGASLVADTLIAAKTALMRADTL